MEQQQVYCSFEFPDGTNETTLRIMPKIGEIIKHYEKEYYVQKISTTLGGKIIVTLKKSPKPKGGIYLG